ncbi:sulfurtransferase-like selenium metabolism protein YedF [Chloroflexota bacterium]
MAKIVDARNLACPQPVLLTIRALEEADEVITIVDNEAAKENVSRLGSSRGCEVAVEQKDDGIYLTLTRKTASCTEDKSPVASGTVVFITSDILGRGENIELGNLLMHSFLNTLGAFNSKPESIIFMNNGVKLVTEDSPVVGEIIQLESQGVEILACGTCLSRLNLMEKVAVGQVSNMYTLAETLLKAEKVIPL